MCVATLLTCDTVAESGYGMIERLQLVRKLLFFQIEQAQPAVCVADANQRIWLLRRVSSLVVVDHRLTRRLPITKHEQ